MKLSTVIGSVNNNPRYYKFIPKQISFWGSFGIRFIAIYIGDTLPTELEPYTDNIIIWNRNKNINSAFVGQNIRMYYTALLQLPDDEMVMMTDMDMLPCSSSYYTSGLENFTKEHFIYYRHIDNNQIYMCYNASHPNTWAKLFNIYSEDDIENRLSTTYDQTYNGIPGSNGWFTDQLIMYSALHSYSGLQVLNRPLKRLEMWIYKQHLQNNDKDFYKLYDDAHFHRDYDTNKELISDAEGQLKLT
jgi:hypothetical protein